MLTLFSKFLRSLNSNTRVGGCLEALALGEKLGRGPRYQVNAGMLLPEPVEPREVPGPRGVLGRRDPIRDGDGGLHPAR